MVDSLGYKPCAKARGDSYIASRTPLLATSGILSIAPELKVLLAHGTNGLVDPWLACAEHDHLSTEESATLILMLSK